MNNPISSLIPAIGKLFAERLLPDQTIVGIFDNARYLDKSVGRLAHAGFKYTVYDEAIVAGEPGNFGPPVFSSGFGPAVFWGSAASALPSRPDQDTSSSGPLKPI